MNPTVVFTDFTKLLPSESCARESSKSQPIKTRLHKNHLFLFLPKTLQFSGAIPSQSIARPLLPLEPREAFL